MGVLVRLVLMRVRASPGGGGRFEGVLTGGRIGTVGGSVIEVRLVSGGGSVKSEDARTTDVVWWNELATCAAGGRCLLPRWNKLALGRAGGIVAAVRASGASLRTPQGCALATPQTSISSWSFWFVARG